MQSNGLADHTDLRKIEQMQAKHPLRKKQLQDLPIEILRHLRKLLDHDKFIDDLLHLPTDSALGLDGLRNEHLKPLLFGPNRDVPAEAWQAVEEFYQLSNQIVKVNLPLYFYAGHVATRLVPANKVHPRSELPEGVLPDGRSINVAATRKRLLERTYLDPALLKTFDSVLAPVQNGAGVKNGISITVMGAQLALESSPNLCIIKGDLENAYNEIMRASIIEALLRKGVFNDILVAYIHTTLCDNG